MISKELLENVLYGESIDNISVITNTVTFEYSHYVNGIFQYRRKTDINIYELAHNKCKEWAKSKEFIIHSSPTQKIEYTAIAHHFDLNKFYYGQNQFYALSEYEAIFKAAQWILDNVKTNSLP